MLQFDADDAELQQLVQDMGIANAGWSLSCALCALDTRCRLQTREQGWLEGVARAGVDARRGTRGRWVAGTMFVCYVL